MVTLGNVTKLREINSTEGIIVLGRRRKRKKKSVAPFPSVGGKKESLVFQNMPVSMKEKFEPLSSSLSSSGSGKENGDFKISDYVYSSDSETWSSNVSESEEYLAMVPTQMSGAPLPSGIRGLASNHKDLVRLGKTESHENVIYT